MKRLAAIGFIWLGCAAAWMILGGTIVERTEASSASLANGVHQLWGPPLRQMPPGAGYLEPKTVIENVVAADGQTVLKRVERTEWTEVPMLLAGTDGSVALSLEHRRKGLMWFPTYEVDFRARYTFANITDVARTLEMTFPLPATDAVYDGFEVRDAAGKVVATRVEKTAIRWNDLYAPAEKRSYSVAYRSRGTGTWHYALTAGIGQVQNFAMAVRTNFAKVDFPAGTLSPSKHIRDGAGWQGEWKFSTLVGGSPIGVELPQKLNPGPLASRITFFAPVGLLFFFFAIALLGTVRGHEFHPMHYFLIGCAFFSFHLLFAYLVDHLAILPAFAVAAFVSIALVVTYARLFVGWRFAVRELALSQLIYLVLFSCTFFWQGFTGLAITIGAVLTLAVIMQITGRARWSAQRMETLPRPDPQAL